MQKDALRQLSYGLFVLTTQEGGRDNGCIVNTVAQVADDPVQIIVAVNKQNLTHDMILQSGVFNVSILSEKASFDIFKHWGFQSGRQVDKLQEIEYSRSQNGLVYLTEGCNGFLSAKVLETKDLGSHTLFVAEVIDGDKLSSDPSATYAYYHQNIKPKAQPQKKKGFICTICGYIYEGDTLPEDFICPLCKHPASDFKPLD